MYDTPIRKDFPQTTHKGYMVYSLKNYQLGSADNEQCKAFALYQEEHFKGCFSEELVMSLTLSCLLARILGWNN